MNKNIVEEQENKKINHKSNFSLWFSDILEKAKIMDIRYPVKGLYVWYPFGFNIRKRVYSIIQELMDNSNHEEVLFPTLIPKTEFMKEANHIKGFEEEVYWVTHGGTGKLDIDLALRPTSETSIYPMFKLWIRSHSDLPLKIYQIVNTFRYETKSTRPLIRLREITSFKEAHTAHETWEQANDQVLEAINIYSQFFDRLCIPTLILKRPEWDKFPGGDFTVAFDIIMPDGKTLQIGTVHHLGENFSKTYDIMYESYDAEQKYINQTCYGISERCIASIIAIHGDNNGLILPSEIAPVQIVIIPILFNDKKEEIMTKCNSLYSLLIKHKLRVKIDDSNQRPGAKYYKWELTGTCIRIEIGPKDIKNEAVTIIDRVTNKKEEIKIKNLDEIVPIINLRFKEDKHILYYKAKD